MNSKRIVFLLLAVIVAGTTAFLARAWLQGERAAILAQAGHHDTPAAPSMKVLVARVAIHTGQIIKPDDLRWQPWPGGDLPATYAVEGKRPLADFVGAVARAQFGAGEPVTEAKLVLANTRGFMSAVLQPGMRAVSVPISATSAVSGFIYAGDRVDVLLTHVLNSAAAGQHNATETILRNARVVAMDQKIEFSPGDKPDVAKTATLELTPKQSEIVTLAVKMGDLSLVLRSLQENTEEGADPALADTAPAQPGDSYTRDAQVSRLIADTPATTPTAPEPARVVFVLRGSGTAKQDVDGSSSGSNPEAKPSDGKPAPVIFSRTPSPSVSQ
jgi:pilus assembly protein CpaB